ncbi:sensor histidine kinase [Pseudonocardia charpentierae]|nr:sensor histidine kinase [Pseudonocardia sp. DSM 45834]
MHRSPEELLEFVVPFAADGVAAEEPTLLLVRPDTAASVLHRVGPSPYLTYQPALTHPGRPAMHLRAAPPMLSGYARVIHQEPVIPPPQWPEWRRLEAALNLALGHHNTWAVCAYDQRSLTAGMVEDLHATHPLIGHPARRRHGAEHRRNDYYQDPTTFLGHTPDTPPDPTELTTPTVELVDPSPATARATVHWYASQQRLPTAEVDNLVIATHEVLANAIVHGRPPTVLRLWAQLDRITVTVTDTGPGPTDPFVGLLPPELSNSSGLGLWLSHQLVDITRRHPHGNTVRLAIAHTASGANDLH